VANEALVTVALESISCLDCSSLEPHGHLHLASSTVTSRLNAGCWCWFLWALICHHHCHKVWAVSDDSFPRCRIFLFNYSVIVTSARPTLCCWSFHRPAAQHSATALFSPLQPAWNKLRQWSRPHHRCLHSTNNSELFRIPTFWRIYWQVSELNWL